MRSRSPMARTSSRWSLSRASPNAQLHLQIFVHYGASNALQYEHAGCDHHIHMEGENWVWLCPQKAANARTERSPDFQYGCENAENGSLDRSMTVSGRGCCAKGMAFDTPVNLSSIRGLALTSLFGDHHIASSRRLLWITAKSLLTLACRRHHSAQSVSGPRPSCRRTFYS